jgi:hypothetical protein
VALKYHYQALRSQVVAGRAIWEPDKAIWEPARVLSEPRKVICMVILIGACAESLTWWGHLRAWLYILMRLLGACYHTSIQFESLLASSESMVGHSEFWEPDMALWEPDRAYMRAFYGTRYSESPIRPFESLIGLSESMIWLFETLMGHLIYANLC